MEEVLYIATTQMLSLDRAVGVVSYNTERKAGHPSDLLSGLGIDPTQEQTQINHPLLTSVLR